MKKMENKILKKLRKTIDSIEGEKSLGSLQDIDNKIEKTNTLLDKVKNVLKEISKNKSKVSKVEVTNPSEIDKKIEVKNLSDIKFPQEIKVNNFPEQKFQREIKINNLRDIKIPSKIEIANFPKQKEINIPEFPKEMKIKKPSWYQAITENSLLVLLQSIANYILKRLSEMTFKGDLDTYKKKDNSLAVRLVDEKGNEYTAISNLVGGGGGLNQKETIDAINNSRVATKENQPVPEHKTYFLYGNTSGATDDLTPTAGKRLRIYGFYGAYHVDSAFTSSVAGSISFGTGGLTDRTKILGVAGELEGARAIIFTMTPMNRLGEVDEIIRFTMPTYSPGNTEANFVILYNEES